VEVDHHIFHLGVVHGALRGAAPRIFRALVVREHADEVDRVEIGEVEAARVGDAAAENEVKLTHGGGSQAGGAGGHGLPQPPRTVSWRGIA
jgi:hypothetical protein